MRVDFPVGWPGDKMNLFTHEGREAQRLNTDGKAVYPGQAELLFDYVSRLFNWRKTAEVIHTGRTLHFITRDNTYAFFRYNDSKAVFVFINNSEEEKTIPWSYYSEISEGLKEGIDVLTGTTVTIDDSTKVAPETALVVEFQRGA